MTDEELIRTLEKYVRDGNCFTTEVRDILLAYKNAGGQQETAQKLIGQLAMNFSDNELLQDRTYDILDIVTSWCNYEMRVWD
ncbi:hypothetical protein J2X31_002193 [Flavobacterium arsenatis]|uniref:Uncharacterized protein n=1 Tax=Flavobacterium arsenatis TaxID=1484332 RepID=A0ABU1TQL7_9FLAO|nr:hypothetical protein [Flavobacterium arsenatis]MDR6968178.1 hypothetical protein [Flavobacterium arsenatis]